MLGWCTGAVVGLEGAPGTSGVKPEATLHWWLFTAALQRFSESTLEYLANLDQAPDPTVRKDAFASDISSAYDTLFHHWLQSREAKVCPSLLATLSHPETALPGRLPLPRPLFCGEGIEPSA